MKVLICGDKNWKSYEVIEEYIKTLPPGSIVIHGDCRGADRMAGFLADRYGHTVIRCPAEWEKYGRAAGPIRNRRMIEDYHPERVVAFHDNIDKSKGTADMIRVATAHGIVTEVRSSK